MTSRKSGVKDEMLCLTDKEKLPFVFECERDKQTLMWLSPKFGIAHETSYVWLGQNMTKRSLPRRNYHLLSLLKCYREGFLWRLPRITR